MFVTTPVDSQITLCGHKSLCGEITSATALVVTATLGPRHQDKRFSRSLGVTGGVGTIRQFLSCSSPSSWDLRRVKPREHSSGALIKVYAVVAK